MCPLVDTRCSLQVVAPVLGDSAFVAAVDIHVVVVGDEMQRDAVAIAVGGPEKAVAATLGANRVVEQCVVSVDRLEVDEDLAGVADMVADTVAVAGVGDEASRADDGNVFGGGLSCLCCLFAPSSLLSCRLYAVH
jgi:hypothetical protein